jgi:hypothetical protein
LARRQVARWVLALAACAFVHRLALAEPAPPGPELLQAIKKRVRRFELLQGKFEQQKRLAKIKRPLKSRGSFALQRGSVLWRTEAPIRSLLVMTHDKVRVIKDDHTVMSLSLSEQPGLRLMGKIVSAVFAGDIDAIRQSFQIVSGQAPANEPWQIVLKPRDAAVAKVIAQIAISGSEHVDSLELAEKNGDATLIRFKALDSERPLSAEDRALLDSQANAK